MATKNPPDANRKRTSHNYDDLTQIKGIGDVTQKWLRDSFAVRTYRDLAALSPKEIENRLRADGKITASSRIEEWIDQARQLARPPKNSAPAQSPKTASWKTLSTFVVLFEKRTIEGEDTFQTQAHHMEADRTRVWSGIMPEDLVEWLQGQIRAEHPEIELGQHRPTSMPTGPVAHLEEPAIGAKLSRYAAKAHQIAGEDYHPPVIAAFETPAPTPDATTTTDQEQQADKLARYITKAQQLADRNRGAQQSKTNRFDHTTTGKARFVGVLTQTEEAAGIPLSERLRDVIRKARYLAGDV